VIDRNLFAAFPQNCATQLTDPSPPLPLSLPFPTTNNNYIQQSYHHLLHHYRAPVKKTTGKKVVAKVSSTAKKVLDPLFKPTPRSSRIGGNIRPAGRDLSRFVKWPKYVRLQRQRAILYQRLKVPPAVNQFTKTLGKNEAATLFKMMNSYRPATPAVKKQQVKEAAAAKAAGTEAPAKAVNQLKFGLKHITTLVEEKKAALVIIACDVDPLELVVWLPTLCRKMNVPYVIVKDKARLGALVQQKTAAALCITAVDKSDEATLKAISKMAMESYNNNTEVLRKWGGGIMGLKTQAKLTKRATAAAVEEEKKIKSMNL
jgi:large subunit ribosomal protein L7Ae